MAWGDWFAVRKELPRERARKLTLLSFLIPLGLWCAVSYLPFLWHPLVKIEDPGAASYFTAGMLVEKEVFASENDKLRAEGKPQATGARENPIYLPAPHRVAIAMYTAFRTPPRLPSACARG